MVNPNLLRWVKIKSDFQMTMFPNKIVFKTHKFATYFCFWFLCWLEFTFLMCFILTGAYGPHTYLTDEAELVWRSAGHVTERGEHVAHLEEDAGLVIVVKVGHRREVYDRWFAIKPHLLSEKNFVATCNVADPLGVTFYPRNVEQKVTEFEVNGFPYQPYSKNL